MIFKCGTRRGVTPTRARPSWRSWPLIRPALLALALLLAEQSLPSHVHDADAGCLHDELDGLAWLASAGGDAPLAAARAPAPDEKPGEVLAPIGPTWPASSSLAPASPRAPPAP
jgi:hypothetical protein